MDVCESCGLAAVGRCVHDGKLRCGHHGCSGGVGVHQDFLAEYISKPTPPPGFALVKEFVCGVWSSDPGFCCLEHRNDVVRRALPRIVVPLPPSQLPHPTGHVHLDAALTLGLSLSSFDDRRNKPELQVFADAADLNSRFGELRRVTADVSSDEFARRAIDGFRRWGRDPWELKLPTGDVGWLGGPKHRKVLVWSVHRDLGDC